MNFDTMILFYGFFIRIFIRILTKKKVENFNEKDDQKHPFFIIKNKKKMTNKFIFFFLFFFDENLKI